MEQPVERLIGVERLALARQESHDFEVLDVGRDAEGGLRHQPAQCKRGQKPCRESMPLAHQRPQQEKPGLGLDEGGHPQQGTRQSLAPAYKRQTGAGRQSIEHHLHLPQSVAFNQRIIVQRQPCGSQAHQHVVGASSLAGGKQQQHARGGQGRQPHAPPREGIQPAKPTALGMHGTIKVSVLAHGFDGLGVHPFERLV